MAQPNHTLRLLNGNYKEELEKLIENGIKADCVVTKLDTTKLPDDYSADTFTELFNLLSQCTWKGTHLYMEVPDELLHLVKKGLIDSHYVLKNTLIVTTDAYFEHDSCNCQRSKYITSGNKFILFACNTGLARPFQQVDPEQEPNCNNCCSPYRYFSNWGLWYKKPERDSWGMMMRISTKHSETILDPFMGEGDIGSIAISVDRHYIGIEPDGSVYRATATRLNNQGE